MNTQRFMIILVVILAISLFIYYAISDRLQVVQYDYVSQHVQLPHQSSLKIALITDLHSCYYGKNQHEILDELKIQQPDMILLVGDIYDDELPPDHTDILLSQLQQLKAKNQIYYVNGNHELWLPKDQYQQVEHKINRYGIHILHGYGQMIPNTNIKIWGVADPVSGQFAKQLADVGKSLNQKEFNILMSHRPEYIKDYLKYPFHLIVSGHAHGGQWRIPYILNGVFAPNQGLFPKYAGGVYDFDQTKFIVSRGLARESTRYIPRIFNRPELVMIRLSHSAIN